MKLRQRRTTSTHTPMEHHSSFAVAGAAPGSEVANDSETTATAQLVPPTAYDEVRMADAFDMYGAPQAPRRRPTRRAPVRRAVAILLLALVVGIIAGVVVMVWTFNSSSDVTPGKRVAIVIPKGSDTSSIARILEDEGVVGNHLIFATRLRLNGDDRSFKAGTYVMRTGSAYNTVVKQLTAGPPPSPVYHVVIPEGFRIADTATRVNAIRDEQSAKGAVKVLPPFTGDQYRAAVKAMRPPASVQAPAGTTSMEGLLFPATYELSKNGTASDFAAKQLDAFTRTMGSVDMSYAKKHGLTPYDVVKIASLIEREARVDGDRAKISSVIYNRLKARMTLGIDATIQYAVSGPDGWKTSLTASDLAIDSPFNSRLKVGLPPTPIASPGLESLQAAAHPATTKYYYYVADPGGSGKHRFHESLDQFNADPWTHAS